MWLGLSLFYVGAVLCFNGLWLLGCIADQEIWGINLFVGLLITDERKLLGFSSDISSVKTGALALLFAFTYLWLAINRFTGADGRGIGWFSFFVSITATFICIENFVAAESILSWWMAINWLLWAVLWALFFAILTLGKNHL